MCYLFALVAILTGWFQSFLIFSSILLIHELGHVFTAKYFKWHVDKITFYPYGGSSKFYEDINRPLKEELWILLMGPLIQILYYTILSKFPFSLKTMDLIRDYHHSILLFNLLPIYPLDGGKLLNIIFCYFLSYRKSLWLTLRCSFVFLFFLFLWLLPNYASSNFVCMFCLLITKLIEEMKRRDYYFHKFLLERYLKNYHYSNIKAIESIEDMMRDKRHLIKSNGHYYPEREVLKKKFKKDRFTY